MMKHWLVIVSFSALVPAGLCSGQDAEVPQAIADAERAEQLRLMHEELSAQLRAIEGEIAKVQNTTEALKSQLEELALQQEGPWGDDRAALEVRAKLVLKVAQVQESLAAELARSRALKEIANALREKVAELREHPQFVEPAAPEPPAGQKPGRLQDKLVELPRDQVVALLDDESFNVRQAAEARLLADDTLDPAALKKLIAQAKSAEQRYRLLRVAEHHVLREVRLREFGDQPQRAAIGFSYQPVLPADNPELTAPAVTVTATMPGFPGHAYLRPGDMVLAINGNAPRGIQHRDLVTTWLSDNIRFHRPGDTVTLTVRRDGTTFDLDVPCGHGNALDQMYTTNGKDAAFRERPYEETWQAARAKLVEGLPEPESLTPAQYIGARGSREAAAPRAHHALLRSAAPSPRIAIIPPPSTPPTPNPRTTMSPTEVAFDESYGRFATDERRSILDPTDIFLDRHIGPNPDELTAMARACGFDSVDALIDATVPEAIRMREPLKLGTPQGEYDMLTRLREMSRKNKVYKSFIGMGYHGTIIPPVILRKVLENPRWYTPYTPYQAEIAQGRLEALLNFQTMVSDLTGLPLAGASLLDEGTAAAEAMAMCVGLSRGAKPVFVAADDCHPQTIAVLRTRCESMGVELRIARGGAFEIDDKVAGVLVQYPNTWGTIKDYDALTQEVHDAGALLVVATDLLALTLLRPPGEFNKGNGADIAIGCSQRFGVPMGFGGPHAAFLATKEAYARKMPGRIIGVSKDAHGNPAYRMALQTREQHIRRDKATSNICTAQVLLAIIAGFYAVYHGPKGLRSIATRVHAATRALVNGLTQLGRKVKTEYYFDTIVVEVSDAEAIHALAAKFEINLRRISQTHVGIALDETTTRDDLRTLLTIFNRGEAPGHLDLDELVGDNPLDTLGKFARTSDYLTHDVFNRYHSESELLRYAVKLCSKDISLADSMIPLGSCTMKLNAASEMIPITWPEFANLHPFVPADQSLGYRLMFMELENWLCEITGFAACSLQPNAGSQGEYAGLMLIRKYHEAAGHTKRDICLIPVSAHGTNPASAVIAGMKVVPVNCKANGDIDLDHLRTQAEAHKDSLSCLMVTYPSTHGVFEESIREICQIVHDHGGMVYMDGANMNAQVGLTSPGLIGADVCHLNLHKTFCIPHGGGGPGMGPICCTEALAPFLPGHPMDQTVGGRDPLGTISAAPYGSPAILPISWMYIAMMGAHGLTLATKAAIVNANYMAARLKPHYSVLYTGKKGTCAHEFILDVRKTQDAGVTIDDFAKRLMDFGFHAPTMSWPVPGTLMFEPTESESKEELDRFCDAMIQIRAEIAKIEAGDWPKDDNPLHNAPHTAKSLLATEWKHPYTREEAAYALPYLRDHKYWPHVGRIDNAHGDRNLVCTCPPMEAYCEA